MLLLEYVFEKTSSIFVLRLCKFKFIKFIKTKKIVNNPENDLKNTNIELKIVKKVFFHYKKWKIGSKRKKRISEDFDTFVYNLKYPGIK